jgi:tetratricopeptide (TPR) repeat protein
LFFFACIWWANCEEIKITEQSLLGFADKLYKDHEFDKALVEFQRFLYYFPNYSSKYNVMLKMARCYKYSGFHDNAAEILTGIISSGYEKGVIDDALFELGDTHYLFGEYEGAAIEFKKLYEETQDFDLKNKAGFMLTFSYLRADEASKASDTTTAMEWRKSISSENFQKLVHGVRDYYNLERKSPLLSGVMSAVIPGTGHFYISRYRDGVLALILNGLFATCAYEFFDKGHTSPGILFSFFEMSIYSGTIFSSVSQTYKYNQFIRNEYIDKLETDLGYHSYSDLINN